MCNFDFTLSDFIQWLSNFRGTDQLEDIRYADPTDDEQSLPYTRRISELLDGPADEDILPAIQKQMQLRKQHG